jgi:ectoine hydroxylase
MKLTQQQIDDFNREGWLFLPELFSLEEVALLAREAEGIYDTQRPEVWREKSGAPRTAFAAHLYNEAFGLLGAHPRMIDPVEQIFGEKLYMHQYKINAKSAFTGDVWQWHQDYGTWKRDDDRGVHRRGDADQRALDAGAQKPARRRPESFARP